MIAQPQLLDPGLDLREHPEQRLREQPEHAVVDGQIELGGRQP